MGQVLPNLFGVRSHALVGMPAPALGAIPYADSATDFTNLAGNTSTTRAVLTQTGNGAASAAPAWTPVSGDLFSQYALLAGRNGGQTLNGGTASGNNLTLDSTSHGTKGSIVFGTSPLAFLGANVWTQGMVDGDQGFQIKNVSSGVLWKFYNTGLFDVNGTPGSTAYIGLNSASANWGIGIGTETISNLYIGAKTTLTSNWFWRGSWSDTAYAANSFKSPSGTTGQTVVEVNGVASQTGALLQLKGESSTTFGRPQVDLDSAWATSTDASRKARFLLRVWDTAARECVRAEASGTEAMLGFYGVSATARQLLATGAGATVDQVITALQTLGLLKQS